MSEEHIPDLSPCESIDIFVWVNTIDDSIWIYMRGKWGLDDDSMDLLIAREFSYRRLEF
jgi:hypothetical protein